MKRCQGRQGPIAFLRADTGAIEHDTTLPVLCDRPVVRLLTLDVLTLCLRRTLVAVAPVAPVAKRRPTSCAT